MTLKLSSLLAGSVLPSYRRKVPILASRNLLPLPSDLPLLRLVLISLNMGAISFLFCVDKWSGYPVYRKLGALTAKAITGHLQTWFNLLGWPSTIRSDRGPQFCGYFKEWCTTHNIKHEVSSPYNPKSNGLAEAAVKSIKYLLSKCISSGQDCNQAVYEWRNVPRSHGYSPAQLLSGAASTPHSRLPLTIIDFMMWTPQ